MPRPGRSGGSRRTGSPRRSAGVGLTSAADPNHSPFSSFLERDTLRETRKRGRKWTIIVSVAVHVLAFVAVLLYSMFDIDELFSPSVEVKMYAPRAVEVPPPLQAPTRAPDQAPMTSTIRTGPSGSP